MRVLLVSSSNREWLGQQANTPDFTLASTFIRASTSIDLTISLSPDFSPSSKTFKGNAGENMNSHTCYRHWLQPVTCSPAACDMQSCSLWHAVLQYVTRSPTVCHMQSCSLSHAVLLPITRVLQAVTCNPAACHMQSCRMSHAILQPVTHSPAAFNM